MTFRRLFGRNLLYQWRGNLAVFLGIALGSAVLTGALLVGDSLRGSLKALTLDQLGWVEQAMLPNRFFRDKLASEISADRHAPAEGGGPIVDAPKLASEVAADRHAPALVSQ